MVCSSIQGGLLLPLHSGCAKGFTSRTTSIFEHNAAGLATSYGERSGSGRGCLKSRASTGDLRPELDENPERIISGEWPDNFSLLVYDDFRAYLDSQAITHKRKLWPSSLLGEVMSTPLRVAMADQMLEEIDHHFELVSGLPVVDSELRCVGMVSKNDRARASNGIGDKPILSKGNYIYILPNQLVINLFGKLSETMKISIQLARHLFGDYTNLMRVMANSQIKQILHGGQAVSPNFGCLMQS
ncbi:uncharacterized protein [Elaeis guineensis]|uniref:uncharacterized protein isoform X2 n=1 Tax=Elaeis guineensis var. tenera TaxID=51953 RepID=UPI003C6CEC11